MPGSPGLAQMMRISLNRFNCPITTFLEDYKIKMAMLGEEMRYTLLKADLNSKSTFLVTNSFVFNQKMGSFQSQ